MYSDISAQDRFYRRGLVLGFTLAEVMVLIIFALLLALSWHLVGKDKEIDKLSQSLKEKEVAVAKLTERTRTLDEKLTEHTRTLEVEVARGDDFNDLFRELEKAKEQANVALREKLDGLRKGTEMPACWASRETGKPEYIFNTALTSRGIIMRDNALPHRAAEQAQLPLQAMVFEKEVRPGRLRVMSKPVFEWSVKEGCRFFVRVYDRTKDEEKMIYKQRLRTVGEHFYYFEVLDGTFSQVR